MIFADQTLNFIAIISTVFALVYAYFHYVYQYWIKKGVPIITPKFPLGNSYSLLPQGLTIGTQAKDFYDEFKKQNASFGGIYLLTEPNLVIVDPDYIRDILAKDFQNFVDRGFYYNEERDPISAHLFALDGAKWHKLRTKLTPTFTSGKMKMMFNLIIECSENLLGGLGNFERKNEHFDAKDVAKCFTIDSIGACAFGVNCNSFGDEVTEFRTIAKKIFQFTTWESIKALLVISVPKLALKLGLTMTTKEVNAFFMKLVRDCLKMRKENSVHRNDFLNILIDLKTKAESDETLKDLIDENGHIFTVTEMAAQVFVFFVAGFDTSSTAMCFTFYELAKNPKIQEKLRREINEVLQRHNGKVTYESLNEMKYLQQVLDESLRKYPPVPTINRRCVKNYKLRDTDIEIEKDTPILISVFGLHRDPEYYPDPENFDPERFSDENRSARHQFTYLPFGSGPRNCIGLRFGVMQAKIGIVTALKNFRLTVSPEMKKVELNPRVFLLESLDKIYLMLEKL